MALELGGTTLAELLTLQWLLAVLGDVLFALLVAVVAVWASGRVKRRIVWCQVNALGDYSVDFLVRAWCDAGVHWDYQSDIKRKVKEALDARGGDPFPTHTLVQATG